MILTIGLCILAFFASFYVVFVVLVYEGLKRSPHTPVTEETPFVSVVVAARNEEDTIKKLLLSILWQDYPQEQFEIIVVDDGSTDGTVACIKELSILYPKIHLLSLGIAEQDERGRKPEALAAGIKAARGEIILITDADCTVLSGWMKEMAGAFEKGTAYVAGPVLESPTARYFSNIHQLEFLGIIASIGGLIGVGAPITCNGANNAFRKSVFDEVGGFGDISSCDDETLMMRIATKNAGKITFMASEKAVVHTNSPESFTEFWRQRLRWASKKGRFEDPFILIKLSMLYFSFVVLLGVSIGGIFYPALLPYLGACIVLKLVLDYRVLRFAGKLFIVPIYPERFLLAELLHIPYIVVAGLAGQIVAHRWKGRTLQQ
jgi:cellulose synthase/poly-beta-1,6-N-acetylglucosamine synthase-like glycosyltransferase